MWRLFIKKNTIKYSLPCNSPAKKKKVIVINWGQVWVSPVVLHTYVCTRRGYWFAPGRWRIAIHNFYHDLWVCFKVCHNQYFVILTIDSKPPKKSTDLRSLNQHSHCKLAIRPCHIACSSSPLWCQRNEDNLCCLCCYCTLYKTVGFCFYTVSIMLSSFYVKSSY